MIVLMVVGACCADLTGQSTLHLVLTANDFTGESIREGCQKDRENTVDLFTAIGELACSAGYDLTVDIHYPRYGKRAVVDYLSALPVRPDDAVIFVFSGHGLQDTAGGDWPILYYCREPTARIDYDGCGLPVEEVHELLVEKGVRMSLALASCCNHDPLAETYLPRIRGPDPGSGAPVAATSAGKYFSLLTDFRGHILASASRSGQRAYLTDAGGSFFLRSFLYALIDALAAEGGGSWGGIMRSTRTRVTAEQAGQQEVQYRIRRK